MNNFLELENLKTRARELCDSIINSKEEKFAEETTGKLFVEVKGIKDTAYQIVKDLKDKDEVNNFDKSTEIRNIFDENQQFKNVEQHFFPLAKDYYIKKVEALGWGDKQINNISLLRGWCADWKADIRDRAWGSIAELVNHCKGLISAINGELGTGAAQPEAVETPPIEIENPLHSHISEVIKEIDVAFLQDPAIKLEELNSTNQNFESQLQDANTEDEIDAIKYQVIGDIIEKRSIKVDINEIERELLKEPKIQTSELEASNQNWRNDIQNGASEAIVKQIKNTVLADIRQKRQAKGNRGNGEELVNNLRTAAINQIYEELKKQPAINESELTNQNWKENIDKAQHENEIKRVRDLTLADIKNKRATKEANNHLDQFLNQARQTENWDNYQNLENILKQIKQLRSSNAYQEKETQIQALEGRLMELDSHCYQETVKKLLDQQVKDNGLTDSNMDEETKKTLAEAKQDPTNNEKKARAEEAISQNRANNDLNNLIINTANKLNKGNISKKEKEAIIREMLQFVVAENGYKKNAYARYKNKVNALLTELNSENSNQEAPSSSWPKILGIATLITIPLIIIIIMLKAPRKRLSRRKRNYQR